MDSLSGISTIPSLLSEWYATHRRELPWRQFPDPYKVWLSEIILQQTRVEQGLPYYHAILGRFPDVRSLAGAPLDDLLKLWQGLGYYSRARNMHAAAVQVVEEFDGRFPTDYTGLLRLKGVGEYTAAAISSICYREARAVVDGNVFRVLARLFNIDTPINSTEGKRLFSSLAAELVDVNDPGTHNQAMMEFGALHCVPVRPDCDACPLSGHCLGLSAGRVVERPVKTRPAAKQIRHFWYLVPSDGRHTWLQQRTNKDIWQHLWEFPLIETPTACSLEEFLKEPLLNTWFGSTFTVGTPKSFKHVLSHRVIQAVFLPVRTDRTEAFPESWTRVSPDGIDQFAIARLTELYLENPAIW
jgi:A/G-specific adenine glycosylase